MDYIRPYADELGRRLMEPQWLITVHAWEYWTLCL